MTRVDKTHAKAPAPAEPKALYPWRDQRCGVRYIETTNRRMYVLSTHSSSCAFTYIHVQQYGYVFLPRGIGPGSGASRRAGGNWRARVADAHYVLQRTHLVFGTWARLAHGGAVVLVCAVEQALLPSPKNGERHLYVSYWEKKGRTVGVSCAWGSGANIRGLSRHRERLVASSCVPPSLTQVFAPTIS